MNVRNVSLVPGCGGVAAGSALFTQGNTRVFATVYGPHESPHASGNGVMNGTIDVRVTLAPFSTRARALMVGTGGAAAATADEERRLEEALSAALTPSVLLERLPKAVVDVHVLIIETDGGELAAAVTAASAALVDAGIEVRDAVVGARVRLQVEEMKGDRGAGAGAGAGVGASASAGVLVLGGGGGGGISLLVDPTTAEAEGYPTVTLALMPSLGIISSATHVGEASPAHLVHGFKIAADAAMATSKALREAQLATVRARVQQQQNVAVAVVATAAQ